MWVMNSFAVAWMIGILTQTVGQMIGVAAIAVGSAYTGLMGITG